MACERPVPLSKVALAKKAAKAKKEAEAKKAADAKKAAEEKRALDALNVVVAAKVAEAMKAVERKQAAEAKKLADALQALKAKQISDAAKAAKATKSAIAKRVSEIKKALEAKQAEELKRAADAMNAAVATKVAAALKAMEAKKAKLLSHKKLLKAALAESKPEDALKQLSEILALEPTNKEYLRQKEGLLQQVKKQRAHARLQKLLDPIRKEKDKVKALALCEKLIASEIESAEIYLLAGELQLAISEDKRRVGDMAESKEYFLLAARHFKKATENDSANQRAYFFLGEINFKLKPTPPGNKWCYERAYAINSDTRLGLLSKARFYELQGQADRAIAKYSVVLNEKDDLKMALLARAELYRRSRKYRAALIDVSRILRSSNDADALVLRAHIRLNQGLYTESVEDLKKAALLDKGNAMLLALLAHNKLLKGDSAAALKACNSALKLDRTCYYAYRVRGEIRLTAKDADLIGAERDFREAMRFARLIARNYYWYGRLLQQNDDKEGALRFYTICIQHDKKHWRAYCNRGTIRRLLHDYDNALRDVDRAVVLQPKNGQVLLQRSKIRWVRLRKAGIDYKEAQWNDVMSDLDSAIKLQPKLSDAYGRRGFIYRRRKQYKEALADYDKAVKLKQSDVYVWYGYRGLLYAEYGKYKEAIADFDEYLKAAASTHQIYSRIQKERARSRREMEKK